MNETILEGIPDEISITILGTILDKIPESPRLISIGDQGEINEEIPTKTPQGLLVEIPVRILDTVSRIIRETIPEGKPRGTKDEILGEISDGMSVSFPEGISEVFFERIL